jgi:hypothetical protein
MKKNRASQPLVSSLSRERQVQQEIAQFLSALHSYPARAARDPLVTFEQHLFSIIARAGHEAGRSLRSH